MLSDEKESNSNNINNKEEEEEKEDIKEYPIEKIIARKLIKRLKKIHYLVKWQDYEYEASTWEPLQTLIEDMCFEKIFNYENQSLEEKIELLNKFKELEVLKKVTERDITATEYCEEMKFFRENYQDFNPIFKEKFETWEYGNLNDDIIDYIIPFQKSKEQGMMFKCFWKKRQNEREPRKPRYYPLQVIKSIDKESFHKSYLYYDNYH